MAPAVYKEIRHTRGLAGKPIAVGDAMIGATGRGYGVAAIATRNTRDFPGRDVILIEPWLHVDHRPPPA